MSDTTWTIDVLQDLIVYLDDDRYEFARYQLADAIESIRMADEQPKPLKDPHVAKPALH